MKLPNFRVPSEALAEVHFSLSREDFVNFQVYAHAESPLTEYVRKEGIRTGFLVLAMLLVPTSLLIYFLVRWNSVYFLVHRGFSVVLATIILLFFAVMVGRICIFKRRGRRAVNAVLSNVVRHARHGRLFGVGGAHSVWLTSASLLTSSRFSATEYLWRGGIRNIVYTPAMLIFWTTNGTAVLIPSRAFATEDDAGRFAATASKLLAANGGGIDVDVVQHLSNNTEPCPRCRYLLRGVGSSVCPECGLELNFNMFYSDTSTVS